MSQDQQDRRDRMGDQAADDEVNGIPGQLIYPDREVDAERAAAFAGGKEETLYPENEGDVSRTGWQNPADNRNAEQVEHNETEPAEMRHEGDLA